MPRLAFHRVSSIRKIENWKSVQQEVAVIDGRVAADIYYNLTGIEFPFGMRQFAGSNRPVVNCVIGGTGFLHALSREGERRGGSQNGSIATESKASRGRDIVKAPRLGRE